MRHFLVLWFFVCVLSAAAQTQNSTIIYSAKGATLAEIFKEIRSQTGYEFIYSTDMLKTAHTVDVNVKDSTVPDLLEILFKDQPLTFVIRDKRIIIQKKAGNESDEVLKKNGTEQTSVNTVVVSGRVLDGNGDGLPGASVFIEGTMIGASTDSDGMFSLIAGYNDVLSVSFIGFKGQKVLVDGRNQITVTLEEELLKLGEVTVNAGYYDVIDREKTGSIARVSSKEIERQPVTNPLQALQGRMPGVTLQQATGVPGGNFTVRIRGTNSLNNGNDPLYIIDGVPFISGTLSDQNVSVGLYGGGTSNNFSSGQSPMNTINPNDIESVEILKDADATAIYGSRGANGVVLITTKKGKSGSAKITGSLKSGVSFVTERVDLMNTEQYLFMRNAAVKNDKNKALDEENDINGRWDQTRYTDWQKALLGGKARTNDANFSVSGGNNETQFLFGAGYNIQGTVFPGNNEASRFTTHFSVNHTSANKKFSTSLSTNYSILHSNIVGTDLTNTALILAPNAPALYDSNGNLNWENNTWANPLAMLNVRLTSQTFNLLTNVGLGYEIIEGLRLKANFSINDIRNEERSEQSSSVYNPASANSSPANSSLFIGTGSNRSWTTEPQINWDKNIGRSKLAIIVGGTYQQRISDASRNEYIGFPSNALINDPKSATTALLNSYSTTEYRYAAVYGRVNYNLNEKIILNLTGRRDGSSRFGPGRQFANLGAIGAAWIFSNESFLKDKNSFLSFGKLRASYGITGNDQIGDYQYLDTYISGGAYNGGTTLVPKQLFNPDYSWETTQKLEAALEFGFIQDRILGTISYYRNRSSNQLLQYKLAATTGNPSVLENFPATVQNTGLEFDVTSVNISRGAFKWTTSFNITLPHNKLVAFPGLESSSYAGTYLIGAPLTLSRTYHFLGVNPTTGQYQFEDFNHDGAITPDDKQTYIARARKFFGGMNNGVTWKGFQLDVFFQFVSQKANDYCDNYLTPGLYSFGTGNQPARLLERAWQSEGDIADTQYFSRSVARINDHSLYVASDANSKVIYYIRLSNVSLSYQIPDRVLKGLKGRFYVQAQNLLTITNYSGLDPETGYGSLPPLTTLIAGVQFTL